MCKLAFSALLFGAIQSSPTAAIGSYPIDFGVGSFTGNYLITGAGTIKGVAGQTILRAADPTLPIIQIGDGITSTSQVEISDIRLIGSDYHSPLPDGGVFQTSDAIYILGANEVSLKNVTCANSLRDCINLDSTSAQPTYDVHINDLRCDYPKRDCIHAVMGGTATHQDLTAYVAAIYVDNFFLNAEASPWSHSIFTDAQLQMSNGYIEPGGIAMTPAQIGASMVGGIEVDVNASCKMPIPTQPWSSIFVDGNSSPQTTVLVQTQNPCGGNYFASSIFAGSGLNFPGLYRRADGTTAPMYEGATFLNAPRLIYPLVEQSILFNDHSAPIDEPSFDDPANTVSLYRYGSVDAGASLVLDRAGFRFPMTAANPLQCNSGGGCGSLWKDGSGELRWEPGTWAPSSTDPGPLMREVSVPASATAPCAPGQTATDKAFLYICVAPNIWRRLPYGSF